MIKKILLPIAFFLASITCMSQAFIGTGTRSDCVGGYNLYYFSGGTVSSWQITGTYTNLVVSSDKASITFNWSGAYTGAKITVNYSSGGCSSCSLSTATFNVSAMITPSVSITPATVSVQFGTQVTLTASPTNGGASPSYTWYRNDVAQSGNTNNYTSTTLQNADRIYVYLQSSATCLTSTSVKSVNTVIPTITYSIATPVVSSPPPIPYNTGVTLTASGATGSEVYRWYNSNSGGTYIREGLNFPIAAVLDNQTWYVSKFNGTIESSRVPQVVTVVVPPPTVPVVSTNTCGDKTLTMGTPPAGITWNWQGTNSAGTSINTNTTFAITEATAQTYYLRAKIANSNVWSTSVGVEITTDPVDLDVTSYQPENAIVQASHSITLKPGFTVPAGSTFIARIAITSECNDIYNWSEQIAYDQNGQPLARARSYSSGLGQELQSQTIDYASGKIWVTQPIYDKNNNASASTLPAPISEQDFIFKKKFVTNVAGQPYSDADFNLPINSNAAGEIKNPKPVDTTKPNTVGWYYSANNTLEPNTPITSFPYSRSYTPEGPDPTVTTSAGPGDQYKMGSNNEVIGERQKFIKSELWHYFALRSHFVTTPLPVSVSSTTNLLSNADATSTNGFTSDGSVILSAITQNSETYVKAVNNKTVNIPPPMFNVGTATVTAGVTYIFKVKGYRTSAHPVYLSINPGMAVSLPGGAGNEGWVETTFIASTSGTINLGLFWGAATVAPLGDAAYINAISLTEVTNPETMTYGYRFVSTDPDGKKTISYSDADGNTLASALMITDNSTTPPTYTYDYWNYSFYNDMGQLVATVAPNGVIIGNLTRPKFVTTFKYDHLGRMIETTSPDEGTSQFVYSLDGKIRFSQNDEQRMTDPIKKPFQNFSYTNYDYLGRLIESGEYTSNGTNPFVFQPHDTPTGSISPNSVLQNSTLEATGYTALTQKLDATRCTDYTYVEYDNQATDLPNVAPYDIQKNTFGQVTKTQNANATTWYSYDEFGQLEWSKQSLPDIGYKTVSYTYDYFGNVTQVVYQSGQSDKFYHYYTYDVDQRLTQVETSLDGVAKTLQAKYYYYLHGPLKRVELAGNLQGIDYTYTLQGALKSINHMDVENDPGDDGTAGAHSNFSKDVFGLTLSYFDNDFSSAGHNAGNVSPAGSPNSYAGALKGVGWFTPVDNTPIKRSYNYTYDSRNQLQNAQWGTVTGANGSYTTTLAGNNYREGMGAVPIDKNGNIKSMVRNGKTGTSVANYTYDYEANTNKLDKVNDGGSILVDYGYNTIGQMTSYIEAGNTISVFYNVYGLVREIKKGSTMVEKFVYDDRGDRVQKMNYDNAGSLTKTTYYVHDVSGNVLAVYEKPTSTSPIPTDPVEVPIYGGSRLGEYKPGKTTFYELTDHLGNVRTVIGAPFTETITATMETENMTAEDKLFKNIAPRTISSSAAANSTPGGNEAIFLNNARPVGPASIVKVAPGDVISISTYAYYEGGTGYNSTTASSTIVSAIISAFGGVNGAPGEAGKIYTALSNAFSGGGFSGLAGSSDTNVPAAYLNMIMFDGNMVADPLNLPMSAEPVTSVANWNKQLITIGPITIPTAGYIYVYVNDNSNSVNRVYFDDLAITHLHSPFVAGGDFYPYGLTMEDRQIKIEPYRYGFQGQFSEKDETTGWNEFELRMYDARFGRWISPDPYGQYASPYLAMGNTPNMGADPDGGWCCATVAEVMANESMMAAAEAGTVWGARTMLSAQAIRVLGDLSNGIISASINSSVTYSTWEPIIDTNLPSLDASSLPQPSYDFDNMPLPAPGPTTKVDWNGGRGGAAVRAGRDEVGGVITDIMLMAVGPELIVGKAAMAGISLYRSARAARSVYKIRGVYDITITGSKFNGRYIGEAADIVKRLKHHTGFFGKFRGHKVQINEIYSMPNSSSRYREVLEQQILNTIGGPNAPGILNKINPHRASSKFILF